MELDQKAAAEIAQRYFRTKQPLTRLGWGISGYVYLSPDLQTAVKVHRREESFRNELEVYRRLRKLRISNLHGLTIPKLRGYRTDLKLIRMDFVRAPYLLDFAGVRFIPPDFPADTMELWHAGIEENFAPHTNIVYAVYNTLSGHGLYYLDFRPSNLKLQGHPDLMNESK
jgi:hypothetical protein